MWVIVFFLKTLTQICYAGTGLFYIIAGQHTFSAAREVAVEAAKAMQEVPQYTKMFCCKIIKARVLL